MKLPAIQQEEKVLILGLDHPFLLAEKLHLDLSSQEEHRTVIATIHDLMMHLSEYSSGVCLQSHFGFESILQKSAKAGLLFSLEHPALSLDPLSVPVLNQSWGPVHCRNNYALAKLQLYYNPAEEEALTKKQLLAEIYDSCKYEGIDLLLDLIVYVESTQQDYKNHFQEIQLQAIRELQQSCSCMALEFPGDALGAVTVTAEIDIPWLLSAKELEYGTLKEQLRTALESGASGLYATDIFYPNVPGKEEFSPSEVEKQITTTLKDRIIELNRIVLDSDK